MTSHRTATATLTGIGSQLGHQGGDYLVQPDYCARNKQERSRRGRWALALHAASYAATQAVTKSALYAAAGHRVHPAAQLAGAVTEGVLHAAIDDGRALETFARRTGKHGFFQVNAGGINGRALMDQAAHQQVQIPAGIIVTTLVDAVLTGRRSR